MAELRSVQALGSSVGHAIPPEFVRSEHEQPGATTFRGDAVLEIPVIDMSANGVSLGARLAEAAREWGLFHVVNHGVPVEAVAELQRVGRGFFALPQEEKERYAMDSSPGIIEGYGTKLQRDLEGKKTWVDFFHYVAPPAKLNHGIWPGNLWGYREANEEYCQHIQRLTWEKGAMKEAFGGVDRVVFLQKINFYSPCPQPELTLGVAPHTDMSTLTILVPNEVQGLQVFKDGYWHGSPMASLLGFNLTSSSKARGNQGWLNLLKFFGPTLVIHISGPTLVIHIGDQIEILSNGRYKAVLHRTTVDKEKTRISWPVFVEPPPEHVVGPHRQLVTDGSPAKYKAKRKDYQYCKINKLPL